MSSEASPLGALQSMSTTFILLFFSFTVLFSVFSLLIFILRMKPWCNCETCRSYLTMSWTSKFKNLCDWYTHLLRQSPTGTIHVHVLGNTITTNPENVEYILKTRFDNYPKGKPFSTILGDLLGQGIFNVDGDCWKFQRKMASLELGSVAIRTYALEIVTYEIQSRLIPLLASTAAGERDGVMDLQDILRRFSFDNICKFSFGLDPGCLLPSLPVSRIAVAFDEASRLSAERAMMASPMVWKVKRLLNMGSEKKLKEAINVVNDLAEEMISQRRQMGFSTKKDLLSRFMSSVKDDVYLRDIVVSFLLAGRDTVAAALTGFFYLLSNHPQVESLIREELDRIMDPGQAVACFEQMRRMHYLTAAVYESMRLYPPVQFDSKFAVEDDILPDEFKPERWLQEGVFVPGCPYKYPVFQAGARVCLGKELALVEIKSVVAALVKRFDIRIVDGSQEPRFARVSLPPLETVYRFKFVREETRAYIQTMLCNASKAQLNLQMA
ncbi:hypothetical protein L6164_018972 [Bauhinia variegata]|uniref:Uncharacterized protein n=1 Tax=Bauhinia variegata TaxID=167791 RepID=A0ACB9NGE2_BAUVA|nr:hypothetical protein L6164_018972 [Bauhinia variegata]